MSQQADKRTAVQRLEDTERGLASLNGTMDLVIKDLGLIKEAIKLLGNKVDSIVKAQTRGETINDELIARIMIENNVEELKGKVSTLVAQGFLTPQTTISIDSFLVTEQLDVNGAVTNPRLQFAVAATEPDVQPILIAAKVGDTVSLKEGKLSIKILESYLVQEPPQATEVNAAGASEEAAPAIPTAPEVPAAQQSDQATTAP
jgi:hypothetical protein